MVGKEPRIDFGFHRTFATRKLFRVSSTRPPRLSPTPLSRANLTAENTRMIKPWDMAVWRYGSFVIFESSHYPYEATLCIATRSEPCGLDYCGTGGEYGPDGLYTDGCGQQCFSQGGYLYRNDDPTYTMVGGARVMVNPEPYLPFPSRFAPPSTPPYIDDGPLYRRAKPYDGRAITSWADLRTLCDSYKQAPWDWDVWRRRRAQLTDLRKKKGETAAFAREHSVESVLESLALTAYLDYCQTTGETPTFVLQIGEDE